MPPGEALDSSYGGGMIGARLKYVCYRGESGRVMPYRRTPLIFVSVLMFVSLAVLFAGPSTPALAATYVVDTTSDSNLTACPGPDRLHAGSDTEVDRNRRADDQAR